MVALLAEGVDRNLRHGLKMQGAYVALLAEGVDCRLYTSDAADDS